MWDSLMVRRGAVCTNAPPTSGHWRLPLMGTIGIGEHRRPKPEKGHEKRIGDSGGRTIVETCEFIDCRSRSCIGGSVHLRFSATTTGQCVGLSPRLCLLLCRASHDRSCRAATSNRAGPNQLDR